MYMYVARPESRRPEVDLVDLRVSKSSQVISVSSRRQIFGNQQLPNSCAKVTT